MGVVAEKCPNCGANVTLSDNQKVGYCKYCGTKITNEHKNTEKVEFIDNNLEAQIAQAELAVDLFITRDVVSVFDYNNTKNMIANLEGKGANDTRFYLILSKFITEANFKAFQKNIAHLISKEQIINTYDVSMKNAIKYCKDELKKEELSQKYEDDRENVINKLNYYENLEKKRMWKKIITVGIISVSLVFIPMILVMLYT